MYNESQNSELARAALERICNNTSRNPDGDAAIIGAHFDKTRYQNVYAFIAMEGKGIVATCKEDIDGKFVPVRMGTTVQFIRKKDRFGNTITTLKTDSSNRLERIPREYNNAKDIQEQFDVLMNKNYRRIRRGEQFLIFRRLASQFNPMRKISILRRNLPTSCGKRNGNSSPGVIDAQSTQNIETHDAAHPGPT